MIDYVMIAISCIGLVISISTFLLLMRVYHKYRKQDLQTTAIGFLLYGLIAVSYIILGLGQSHQIAELATALHRFLATVTFGIGFSLTLIGFLGLIEVPYPRRYWLWIFTNVIIVPYAFTTGFHFVWEDSHWIAVYDPPFLRYLAVSPALYVGIEIGLSTFKLIKDSPITRVKVLYIAMTMSFLLTIPLFILRQFIDMPFNLFILPIVLYFIFLALIITSQPEIFLTTSQDPLFLLMIETDTGLPVRSYHFVQNDYIDSNEALMAGAISAIQSVLKEASASEQELDYIGLEDLHIQIKHSKDVQFLLSSKQQSDALTLLLDVLDKKFVEARIDITSGRLDQEEITKLNTVVRDVFIHQLNRLDLILKSMDH